MANPLLLPEAKIYLAEMFEFYSSQDVARKLMSVINIITTQHDYDPACDEDREMAAVLFFLLKVFDYNRVLS